MLDKRVQEFGHVAEPVGHRCFTPPWPPSSTTWPPGSTTFPVLEHLIFLLFFSLGHIIYDTLEVVFISKMYQKRDIVVVGKKC